MNATITELPLSSKSGGWVKLHRRLLEHPRFSDGAWLQVWLFLLLKATHAEYSVVFGGNTIRLQPGQLITSRGSISAACKLSESKVERILEKLKTEQQIEQLASSKSRLITITNWSGYQNIEHQNGHQSDSNRTTGGQQPDTNKNGENKENKENKENGESARNGARAPKAATDSDWLKELAEDPAFKGVSVEHELAKAQRWCREHHRECTRRFFINWLNRAEKTIDKPSAPPPTDSAAWHRHVELVIDTLKRNDGVSGKDYTELQRMVREKKPFIQPGGAEAKERLQKELTPWGLKLLKLAWAEEEHA